MSIFQGVIGDIWVQGSRGFEAGAFGFNGLDLLPDVIFRKAILPMGRSVCRISVLDIGDREFSVLWEDPFSDINMLIIIIM